MDTHKTFFEQNFGSYMKIGDGCSFFLTFSWRD